MSDTDYRLPMTDNRLLLTCLACEKGRAPAVERRHPARPGTLTPVGLSRITRDGSLRAASFRIWPDSRCPAVAGPDFQHQQTPAL